MRTYSSSSAPYFCTVLTESNGNGFSQPIASSPIGSVNSASIPVRWRRNTTAELGMGWPHAGMLPREIGGPGGVVALMPQKENSAP